MKVPRVVSLFLWQACNNVLPTKENLFKRKITDDPLCTVCLMEVETAGHALWSCTAARDVWVEMSTKTQKNISEENEFSYILLRLLDRLEESEFEKVACIAQEIWLRRNKLVFEGPFTHPKTVAIIAAEQLDFHLKVSLQNANGNRPQTSQEQDKWKAPCWGFVKINQDTTLDKQKKLMGVGVVVRDHTGGVIATQCNT